MTTKMVSSILLVLLGHCVIVSAEPGSMRASTGATPVLMSGDGQHPPVPPAPDWNKLADDLNVYDSQRTSFISIMTRQHEQRMQMQRKLHEQMRELMRGQMEAMDRDVRKQLASVLAQEQLQRFEQLMSERRESHLAPDGKPMPEPPRPPAGQ